MRVSRRTLVKAGSAATLATLAGSTAHGGEPTALVIYDSRSAMSRMFARAHGGRKVDVAAEHDGLWRSLRDAAPAGRIVGLTRWSDHVLARGFLEEQRRRVKHSQRRGALIYWEMA